MELDERVMDKILADVKEIVAEADGTLRFIFYSPYSEEVEDEDTEVDSRIEDLRNVIIAKENYITKLMNDIESRDATIKLLEQKLAGGRND
nr:MAG TPA: hypothetical protein [Caudoviricetes sp.]